jgi:predicted lipoprotein with Yx(FWY)xxD motif
MNSRLAVFFLVAGAALAACGGGGGTSPVGVPQPGPTLTVAPTPTPTPAPAPVGNLPLSETVGASAGWVDPSSHRTLYFLDVDTTTGATCTAGCLGVWPVFAPVSGSAATENMTIVTRSDGTGQQWDYQGHPLYHYAGDSGPDQANGEGIPDFGGHWHVARSVAPTPAPPGQTEPPCHTYC